MDHITSSPPSVLVVEDEPLSQDMLVRRLSARGFRVDAVANGLECLQRLDEHVPDLVLLDVAMPGLSGLEVLRRIRQKWPPDRLPVIMVTAMVDSDDVIAGLEAGANDYVVKPVNLPVLVARMNASLRIRQSVLLLMEAERQRAMLETLSRACNEIAQPMSVVMGTLQLLLQQPNSDTRAMSEDLEHTLAWTRHVAQLLGQLRKIAEVHSASYTDRLNMIGPTHAQQRAAPS